MQFSRDIRGRNYDSVRVPSRVHLRMETEKGTVVADSYNHYRLIDTENDIEQDVPLPPDKLHGATETVRIFAEYIAGAPEPPCSGRNNLRTMQMVCAAIKSSQQGLPVRIPESADEPVD